MANEKKKYIITGFVRGLGDVKRHTHAFSASQAIRQVAKKLEEENPRMHIYIQNAAAEEIPS